jgi:plasmid stabilization system protein ParE
MKRAKVLISVKAKSSIKDIYDYLKEEVSLDTAIYVKKTIFEKCYSPNRFSGFSKELYLNELNRDIRSVSQWNYNIIYEIKENTVRILNIIHTSRHPDSRKDI